MWTNPCEGTSCTLRWRTTCGWIHSTAGRVHPTGRSGSSPRVHHPKHAQLGCGLIDVASPPQNGSQVTSRCHTLDSGLFMEFPASFSFSGSAFVSSAWLACLSCLLRITYTATKQRKAPTSKKNCSPRYLWGANTAGQGMGDHPKHSPALWEAVPGSHRTSVVSACTVLGRECRCVSHLILTSPRAPSLPVPEEGIVVVSAGCPALAPPLPQHARGVDGAAVQHRARHPRCNTGPVSQLAELGNTPTTATPNHGTQAQSVSQPAEPGCVPSTATPNHGPGCRGLRRGLNHRPG